VLPIRCACGRRLLPGDKCVPISKEATNQIVIPKSQQQRAIDLAHEGHQGIVKTKALLRSKVYFPGIDRMAEQTVNQCIACQANTPEKHVEPLQMTDLPPGPWQLISADFCGPLPNGQYLFCLMDDYSRFYFAEPVTNTSAKAVIPVLDRILSSFGNIKELRSNNGPPFSSHEFTEFARYYGFHHRRITPLKWRNRTFHENYNEESPCSSRGREVLQTASLLVPESVQIYSADYHSEKSS